MLNLFLSKLIKKNLKKELKQEEEIIIKENQTSKMIKGKTKFGKKTKKGLTKTINYAKSIGEYWFEGGNLFITLRTGKSTNVPPLRADALMNLIAPDVIFEITRIKFLTEELHEL